MILETKGYDPLEKVKKAAAERWVTAVNADGEFGHWIYKLVKAPTEIPLLLTGLNQPGEIRPAQAHAC